MAVEAKNKHSPHWGAWIWIKWKAGAPENAWEEWKSKSEIEDVWSTTGEWDCALWVKIEHPDAVEQFVWKDIRQNKWVEKTDTQLAKKYW